ncbi:DUF1697 domain-containing protein [Modestobacter versicolor]|uniref:DUF1697 domain-containing protein n=1 Tax=Modestobacter versicolor TaxID=429133 RepID=UPI0034DF4089
MTRYALLLRGINVGRAHRVPMAELRELLTAEGLGGVRTLLQSGNVVAESELPPDELARSMAAALHDRFGFEVPTLVRTAAELLDVVARDPLRAVVDDPSRYVVWFAATALPAELGEWLQTVKPGDDAYAVEGRELYLWCPHGQLQSPLAAALAKRTGGPSGTARNWNTVTKLADLLAAGGAPR